MPEQNAHSAVIHVANHQVRLAIAIDVGDRDVHRRCTGGVVHRRLKCSIAIAEQNRDGMTATGTTGAAVADNQVGLAISVEVAHGDAEWLETCRKLRSGPKCPIAIAQEDADAVAENIGHGDIELAVAVEVCEDDANGSAAGGERLSGSESAISAAGEDADAAVCDRGIELAIAVEIAQCGMAGQTGR